MSGMPDRYLRPGWFTRNVFNRIVAALTGLGVSVLGSRVLEVRGRTSGEPRRVPVNLDLRRNGHDVVARQPARRKPVVPPLKRPPVMRDDCLVRHKLGSFR
jgi:hypothetical protein